MTLCIQASLSGDYQLPDDSVLVSGVYWLSLHPPVERFYKKVTITIQHCASDNDSAELSFITAQCTQRLLPYCFKTLSCEGEHTRPQTELSALPSSKSLPEPSFSKSREGTIEVDHFSAFGIMFPQFMGLRKNYAFCTYYIKRQLNCYEAHITVTPDLDLQLKVGII